MPLLRRRIAALLPQARPVAGDLFGSILVGALLEGQALSAAADLAADFVADAIAATPEEADSRYGVQFEPMLGRLAKR